MPCRWFFVLRSVRAAPGRKRQRDEVDANKADARSARADSEQAARIGCAESQHRRITGAQKTPANAGQFVALAPCALQEPALFIFPSERKALFLGLLGRGSSGNGAGNRGTIMLDLAIVGGGPGGLMSAWHLKRKLGDLCRITIFEASDRLGGKMLTCKFDSAPAM